MEDVAHWARRAEQEAGRGDWDAAIFSLAAALQMAPGNAGLHANLAFVFLAVGRPKDAESAAQRALALAPAHALAPLHLAHARAQQGSWSEAAHDYEQAARRLAGVADPWIGRANAQLHCGLRRDAVATLRHAATIDPARAAEIGSHALFAMQYGDEFGMQEVFEAHREWGQRFASAMPPRPERAHPSGRVRVGYVSASFQASAMAFALLPVLAHHDRERFEVTCYAGGDVWDETTARLHSLVTHWRDTRGLDHAQHAQLVRADGIDVLVDLAGHTPRNRLETFALRPAPLQLAWLDYFNTTGVAAIDAILADDESLQTPLGQSFVERLESLGPCRYCWAPPQDTPDVVVRDGGPVTFASFARLAKLGDATIDAWAALLRATGDSRLLLKNDSLADAAIRTRVAGWFAARGIGADRLDLRAASPHREMLAQYADADLVLDTFPYNGGITTLEALWMGRPVVTLRGDTLIARQGAGILAACGRSEWVARDAEGFLAIASTLAADRTVLARHQAGLRDALRQSPLLDSVAFTRRLEALFERLFANTGVTSSR